MTVEPAAGRWEWSQAHFGGGGYITGITLDPFCDTRIYARCDVAGVFISDDGGRHWTVSNADLSDPHTHMVAGLVPSPHQPGLVLRCSGDARDGRTFGSIHRSVDCGATWQEVTHEIDFYGNGPTRMAGEVCSFDPHQPGRVLVGGYRAGVWCSDDAGLTWQRIGLVHERIATIRHHPSVAGLVYLGTVGDASLDGLWALGSGAIDELVLAHSDLPRGNRGTLYRSVDGGATWEPVHSRSVWGINGIEVDPSRPDQVLLAASDGIHVSEDGGATFAPAAGDIETDTSYSFVRRDPHRSGRYLTAPHHGRRPMPLYESTDHGWSWRPARVADSAERMRDYPAYIKNPAAIGNGITDVVFHPNRPEVFYLTGYYGVSRTDDNGRNFTGEGFRGVETLCAESVVTDPASKRVYVTLCDHTPAISEDGGHSYRPFGRSPAPTSALAVSPHDPDLVVWGAGRKRQFHRDAYLLRTTDGGRTTETVHVFAGRRFIQAITADPHHPGRFYVFVDGDLSADEHDSAGLYRSDDHGRTWRRLPDPFPDSLTRLPAEEEWIESELLPCVVYQKRNGNGANQLLSCDPHHPDRLYLGEWSTGLYRSDDGGNSWRPIGNDLPFGRSRLSILSHIYADPERPDRLYTGFIANGLWRSTNGGNDWTQLLGHHEPINGTSIAVHDDLIAVAAEPMYWTRTPPRIWLSKNDGTDWEDIHPTSFGAVRWKGIRFDSSGTLHAISCGNGIFKAAGDPA